MNIAIITLATININNYSKYTNAINKIYCIKHNYTFISYDKILDDSRPPAWSKIIAIQNNITKYDWLLWIDADAIFLNHNIKLESLIDNNYNMIVSKDNNNFNTGVFILKGKCNWSIKLLNDIYSNIDRINHPWWEQQSFIDLYNDSNIKNQIKVINQTQLNSYKNEYYNYNTGFSENDFILHLPSLSNDIREKEFKKYYDKYIIVKI